MRDVSPIKTRVRRLFRYTLYHPSGRVQELPLQHKMSKADMLAQLGGSPERVLPIYYKHKPIWRGSKFYMNDEARWQNWEQNHFFQGMVPGWGISGIVLREEKATVWPI